MNGEAITAPTKIKGRAASAVASIYFVGGLLVAGYLSFLNPNSAPKFLLTFLFWGLPLGLIAVGFRRDPRGIGGWVLIVVGWLLFFVNLATCSATTSLEGELIKLNEDFLEKAATTRRENDAALSESGWYKFPEPEMLSADTDLSETRRMLVNVRIIYERQESQQTTMWNDLLTRIRSLDGPAYKIDEYESLATDLHDKNIVQMQRVHDALIETVTVAEKLVDFLANKRHAWEVEAGVMEFENEEDVATYDQYLQRMMELDSEVVEIQESLYHSANGNRK